MEPGRMGDPTPTQGDFVVCDSFGVAPLASGWVPCWCSAVLFAEDFLAGRVGVVVYFGMCHDPPNRGHSEHRADHGNAMLGTTRPELPGSR